MVIELSSDKLQRLKELPNIARCEEFPGGNTIAYPPKPMQEEKPPVDKESRQANGDSPRPVELYTLRPQCLPEKGSTTEVSVSHVDSPVHFFIHYKNNWETIDTLSSKLNDFFQAQSNKNDLLPTVEEGTFCCAQFTEDDSWYRARITESYTKGDTPLAQVIYVDFGNHEPLSASRLRLLRKEHAELPMMAVLCALDGAVPSSGDKWRHCLSGEI
ncbi:Tudor domain-containing protein 1 [Desmophyllum pertusum]|uniref:Tudor domain-containing protein 1 n=1 Tax=Desmophyllum pertusum TaxID=174260 RepID=A0A9W9YPK6_9CNID|nr:Tudor domain-containing protein 1 [Desmophyllum pertusum]